jgi:hypothetical protein
LGAGGIWKEEKLSCKAAKNTEGIKCKWEK